MGFPKVVTHSGEGVSRLIYSRRGAQAAGSESNSCGLTTLAPLRCFWEDGWGRGSSCGSQVRWGDLPAGGWRPFSGDSGTRTSFAIVPVCQCLPGALEAECQRWPPHLTSLTLYSCRGRGPLRALLSNNQAQMPWNLNLLGKPSPLFFDLGKQGRCLQGRGGSGEDKATSTILSRKCEALCHIQSRNG